VLVETAYRLLPFGGEPDLTRYRVIKAGRDFHYGIERARRELGYEPDPDLDSHLRETVRWYRSVSS
jgi:nucleoside-diphosphate-sugar epimerase